MALIGCSSTGVIPIGNDSYMIGKKDGAPGLGVSFSVRADVYNEATTFCKKKNLEVKTLNVITTPARLGQLGSTELQFRCIQPNSESAQPQYYKILKDDTLKASSTVDNEYMAYTDATKTGAITLNTNLKGRDNAIKIIGDICSSKNISLISGQKHKKSGATYKITDEAYSSNKLTIKFNCIY